MSKDTRNQHLKDQYPTPPQLIDRSGHIEGKKTCTRCADIMSLEKFDVDNSKADGRKSVCKRCRAEKMRDDYRIDIANKALELDQRAAKIIEKAVDELGPNVPHIAELFHHLIDVFGGPQGLAQHCMSTYLMAKPGTPGRQKMLAMIMQIATKVTDTGAANLPLDLLSDADIERELEQRMRILKIEKRDTA